MIKSIENDNIRVGYAQDLISSICFEDNGFIGRFKLPLFSVFPELINIEDLANDKNLICFVVRRDFWHNTDMKKGFSLSLVECINKTWSEFYEKSARK